MHVLAQHTSVINASVDKVWAIVAAYGSEALWMPTCIESSLEGFGIGSVRYLRLSSQPDAVVRERLEAADPDKHSMRWSVARDDLPGVTAVCDVTMEDVGGGKTRIKYVSQTDLDNEELERDIGPMVEGIFRGIVEALASKLEK